MALLTPLSAPAAPSCCLWTCMLPLLWCALAFDPWSHDAVIQSADSTLVLRHLHQIMPSCSLLPQAALARHAVTAAGICWSEWLSSPNCAEASLLVPGVLSLQGHCLVCSSLLAPICRPCGCA